MVGNRSCGSKNSDARCVVVFNSTTRQLLQSALQSGEDRPAASRRRAPPLTTCMILGCTNNVVRGQRRRYSARLDNVRLNACGNCQRSNAMLLYKRSTRVSQQRSISSRPDQTQSRPSGNRRWADSNFCCRERHPKSDMPEWYRNFFCSIACLSGRSRRFVASSTSIAHC